MAEVHHIEAKLNFADPRYKGFRMPHHKYPACRPLAAEPGEDRGGPKPVRIHNARLLHPAPTLDSHGFQLVHAPLPAGLDLRDPSAGPNGFYQYAADVVRVATGCSQVRQPNFCVYRNGHPNLPADHPAAIKPTPNGLGGEYAMGIHSDGVGVEIGWKADGSKKKQHAHYQVIKMWRSIDMENNIESLPLAVADIRTVSPNDIIYNDGQNTTDPRMYTKTVAMSIMQNSRQVWYYFPHMTPDEVLLFKIFDSREEEPNLRTVFHSAVVDPTTRSNAPLRYTVEVAVSALCDETETAAEKEARIVRFVSQINSTYPDGTKSTWFSGPIEGYKPPPALVSSQVVKPPASRL